MVFVVFKIPHLSLPYYWDEAWVYGPAIRMMEAKGLSLLPDALPVYYTRGHPLFFHFLGAAWLKIFGNSVTVSHLFPLLVSVALIFLVYLFGRDIFQSAQAGFLAAFVLVLQPVFLAQSGLLLPEVLLAFLSLLALYFFLKEKYGLYLLTASLALLTKESGVILVATVSAWTLMDVYGHRNRFAAGPWIRRLGIAALPVVPLLVFLFIQKRMNGWFLFPEHLDSISFSIPVMLNKLERYAAYVFIYQGRNLLTGMVLLSIGLFALRKKQVEPVIYLLGLHVVLFILFSSLNFYSNRYMVFVIPAWILVFSYSITRIMPRWILVLLLLAVAGIQSHFIKKHSSSDHDLGYINSVKSYRAAVDYCVANHWQEKKLFASFLMADCLTNPYAGYVRKEEVFKMVTGKSTGQEEYYLFNDVENKQEAQQVKDSLHLELLMRFEIGQAWTEICINQRITNEKNELTNNKKQDFSHSLIRN